jgi:hypothetical protein
MPGFDLTVYLSPFFADLSESEVKNPYDDEVLVRERSPRCSERH